MDFSYHRAGGSSNLVLILSIAVLLLCSALGQSVSTAIKIDHFGYRTSDVKMAIFSADPGGLVEVRSTSDVVVFTIPSDGGSITSKGPDGAPSGDTIWWVDFSSFTTPGGYRLYSPTLNAQSYNFDIRDDIYDDLIRAALKTFYLQRCNTAKESAYAGAWADPAACHMGDTQTAAATGNINHGLLDLTGGWHDAGDYNKYAWTAVSTAILQMLRAFEDNPGVFLDGDLNIPESGNGTPDILDEIRWELDWLLKMQLWDGSVLYQMHVDGFASDSPPSIDTNPRFYQDPDLESGSVFAGTMALASRLYAGEGMTAYADTLKTAAMEAWTWLQTQGDMKQKVWAAAEVFRLDPTVTSARTYVDNYYANDWAGLFFDVLHYDTHAAITYIQAPGTSSGVVANMRVSLGNQVDYIFTQNDLYRNGMPDWAYFWGSNAQRASYGLLLIQAVKLGETGSHSAQEATDHAQDFLHFFHGQNALSMVYLSNMEALGGEHSSFQLYHAWFGDSNSQFSRDTFIGKPSSVNEPDYPYFKGVDNHGISDNKSSSLGPAVGFVPGGPNKNYSGDGVPPGSATFYNRYYRDWNDQTVWTVRTWEITENSIGYQGPYVALGAYFMAAPTAGCTGDAECADAIFCNGSETCVSGSCVSGTDPCPGQDCDELLDVCIEPVCNNNGTCEAGEDCTNCPNDCISGGWGGCGNGVCEPSLGEDCLSCASDCRGKQKGNQKKQYCCGDGDGQGAVACDDSRCTSDGFACSDQGATAFCCGDGL